jgi:hypothetical protein
MVTDRNSVNSSKSEEVTSLGGMVARIYWMLIGHSAIIFSAMYIASGKSPIITNTVFFLLVMSLILIRFIDIKIYKGQTAEGEPATMKHWQRFTAIVLGYSSAIWLLVFLIARFKPL